MAEPKTKATTASVAGYIKKISDASRRDDCTELVKLMKSVTRAEPVMWGTDIIGFGSAPITYADGRQLDWPITGFSPRKTSLVLYIPGLRNFGPAVKNLGKCKASGGCLHIKQLEDVDLKLLKALVTDSIKAKQAKSK